MNHDIKELLTLAAKACGIEVPEDGPWDGVNEDWGVYRLTMDGSRFDFKWAPHLDDGDCFRMETEKEIDVYWGKDFVVCDAPLQKSFREGFADHNGDKNAARRLASLQVAAELGRRMKWTKKSTIT
jgi:hypothetical protein